MKASRFIQKYTFEQRLKCSGELLAKYPERIPIICEPAPRPNIDVSKYDKTKYLVPAETSIGKFLLTIREKLSLTPDVAIFLFVADSTLPSPSSNISSLYKRYKAEDGFLYFQFAGESTFG